MKSTVALMVLGASFLLIGNSVNAWGGIYNNRFSPEMLQNMGYGAPHRIYQEVSHKISFYSLDPFLYKLFCVVFLHSLQEMRINNLPLFLHIG